jgi:L-ascorbate metabolism protein UlaG (beta-lactamase superfamily)
MWEKFVKPVTGCCLCVFLLVISTRAAGQETSTIRYLANAGVMIAHGESKILFDPIFHYGPNTYQRLPQEMRDAIMAGEPPYDDVDGVFVSHFHPDHFSASGLLELLNARNRIRLYAPAQAVTEMRQIATPDDHTVFDRVTIFDLEHGDPPVYMRTGSLLIEAIHVPHSGWPTRRTDVQNIAFRVTLEDTSTVVHLGDADARLVHFEQDQQFWEERQVDLALPPYWFLLADDGREILEDRIYARDSIGIHVPAEFAEDRSTIPQELLGEDLFMQPGEGRRFIGSQ